MPHICLGWGVCIDVIISESFAFFVSNACIVFFMTRSSSFFLNVNFMSNLISVFFQTGVFADKLLASVDFSWFLP